MITLRTACASLAMLTLISGMAFAQAAAPKMTKAEMRSMQKCQAMSNDAMMKNKKCAAMMKAHPEMMKAQ